METDARAIWRLLAEHYYLFRGTPSRMWFDHVFQYVFGLEVSLTPATADLYFDHINTKLATAEFFTARFI